MASESPSDILSAVLTPALLQRIFEIRIPLYKGKPIDPTVVRTLFFGGGFESAGFRAAALPALRRISAIGLDTFPALLPYLPSPEHASFPEQAVGLIILLDQGPRQCFDGMDERWASAYFDPLTQRLLAELRALPEAQRPWSRDRWVQDAGADVTFWFLVAFWTAASFVHSETLDLHDYAMSLNEQVRAAVHAHTGDADPYQAEEIAHKTRTDSTSFFRVAMARCPPAPLSLSALVYWMLHLIDTHPVIIRTFGRYPYRNGAMGREDTDAERAFMEQTSGFGAVEEDVRKRIAEDVKAGIWTPIEATV